MTEANICEVNYRVNYSWKDRLRRKLFPWLPCETPKAPATYKDVLIMRVSCELSFADRLRVLVTGRIEIESRTVTENEIGNHETESVARPGHGLKNIQQVKALRVYDQLSES